MMLLRAGKIMFLHFPLSYRGFSSLYFNSQRNFQRSAFFSLRNYALVTRHYNNKLAFYNNSFQKTYRKRVTPSIWKPVLFTLLASGSAFALAINNSAEKIKARHKNMYHFYNDNDQNVGDIVTYREPWIKGIFHRLIQKIENSQLYLSLHGN